MNKRICQIIEVGNVRSLKGRIVDSRKDCVSGEGKNRSNLGFFPKRRKHLEEIRRAALRGFFQTKEKVCCAGG